MANYKTINRTFAHASSRLLLRDGNWTGPDAPVCDCLRCSLFCSGLREGVSGIVADERAEQLVALVRKSLVIATRGPICKGD